MLTTLSIAQFAIAEKLQLDLQPGMTAITGETGAGKSISLDALSLALGARADSGVVRVGADKTDIRAVFDIQQLPQVRDWLGEQELADDEECILRRVISADGRSKAYINGQPVNLSTLKSLGDQLVDIHSQHAHHQLLQREHHQVLLDAYAHNDALVQQTSELFKQWQHSEKQIKQLLADQHDAEQKQQFLSFQLEEFSQLNLKAGEYDELEQRHAFLSRIDAIQAACEKSLFYCREQEQYSAAKQLQQSHHLLSEFSEHSDTLREAAELLDSALIQVDEACQVLRQQLRSLDSNQSEFEQIEQRISEILSLARKHRVLPNQLLDIQQRLQQELDAISHSGERLNELQQQAKQQYADYKAVAKQLSQQRLNASKQLIDNVHQQLSALGMAHCRFEVALNTDEQQAKALGFDNIEFLISTNPASKAQALNKIASGGELSRISLAIQVVTAQSSTIPVLIFDEVDVGIGGATAEVVGQLLQKLGQSAQVICVTHQAQVASSADQHLLVSKQLLDGKMNTHVAQLDKQGRITEIARMIGGVEITQATLNHAEEMLKLARKNA